MRVIKVKLTTGMNEVFVVDHHELQLVHLDDQDDKIFGWFLESYSDNPKPTKFIYLALTGEVVSDSYTYLRSHQVTAGGGYFVVHAFEP